MSVAPRNATLIFEPDHEEPQQPPSLLEKPTEGDHWLQTLSFLIPRKDREAVLGDLVEDRAEMRERGCSRLTIEIQTLWQLLVIVAIRLGKKISLVAAAAWVYRKLSS